MKLNDFDFELPDGLIANDPLERREDARMMHIDRGLNDICHEYFYDLPGILGENDVLVFNQSKVIPARIKFFVGDREVEIFLLKKINGESWEVLVRPGKFFKLGDIVEVSDLLKVKVEKIYDGGTRLLRFQYSGNDDLDCHLDSIGEAPFPPYIKGSKAKFDDYQTVYAKEKGSVAAPTAGLHFSEDLLDKLKKKGVELEFVTLHVGMGTFAPVKVDEIASHEMHSEFFELNVDVAERLNRAKKAGKRVIAVGTTSVRVLESCARGQMLVAGSGNTDIFIYPGYKWKFVDGIVTNFHLPKSTLLMLVASFVGMNKMKEAYRIAIEERYRFYSFGDGMIIL